nr:cytochrome c peroxidase [Diaphorobacter sp. HDW4B]
MPLMALSAFAALAQPMTRAPAPQAQVWLAPGAGAKVVGMIASTPLVAGRYDPTMARFAPDPKLVEVGWQLFHDTRLSDPPGTSCASCHDPARAFGPDLQRGLRAGEKSPGTARGSRAGQFSHRAAPSLLYVRYVPRRYFYQDDDALVPAFFGGLMADASADSLAEQVRAPLLSAAEMNNRTSARLLARLKKNGLAKALAQSMGEQVVNNPEALMGAVGAALQAYLQSDELSPFTSRFDRFLKQEAALSTTELRGLAIFKNPDKGNCASCHTVSETAARPERSLFTDFGYEALATPRNKALAVNRDPRHFDNGLCETAKTLKWPEPDQWCGYVRTPGLRNVAIRQSFMHNGSLKSLREVIEFYNTRGTDPKRWFGKSGAFDDVAPSYHENVNVNSPPLNRKPGSPVALSDGETDDLVAFLRSLTDERYVLLMPSDARR